MNTIRIEIEPDLLLRAKVGKVVKDTGVTVDFAVCEALANFLLPEGYNNLEARKSA